ncbi:MAG: hypothetical protein QM756_02870 [Polyangiaceae bacterium]
MTKLKDKKKRATVSSTPVATVKITATNEARNSGALEKADVEIVGVTKGQTNDLGIFDTGNPQVRNTFKIFPPGTYLVKLSKPGFGPFTPPITREQEFAQRIKFLSNDQLSTPQNELTIRMGPANPKIIVTVFEVSILGDVRPMVGATVDIIGTAKGSSNNSGVFSAAVPFGQIGVTVSKPGFQPETQDGSSWFQVVEVAADTSLDGTLSDYELSVRMISLGTPRILPGTHPKPLALWLSGGPSSVAEDASLDPPSSVDTLKGQAGWDFAMRLLSNQFSTVAANLGGGKLPIPGFLGGGAVAANQIRRLAIVSHGDVGLIDVDQRTTIVNGHVTLPQRSNAWCDQTFARYAPDLQSIGKVLSKGALVYLLACNLAIGALGEQLLMFASRLWPTVRVVGFTTVVALPTTLGNKPTKGQFPGFRDTRQHEVDPVPNRAFPHEIAAICDDLSQLPWASETSPHATVALDGNIIRRGRAEP